MRPPETFIGQPIRSLQTMLRIIAQSRFQPLTLIPDGIYGGDTRRAVLEFQRRNGLAATGVTDQETWDAIVAAYELAVIEVSEACPLIPILNPMETISAGEARAILYLAQGILTVLNKAYGSVTPCCMNGTLDLPTAESLRSFQELSNLPPTGELDHRTWMNLARQYPLASILLEGTKRPPAQVRSLEEETGNF